MKEYSDIVADYLSKVTRRLEADGFRVSHDIGYGSQDFKCVARKRRPQIEFAGLAETFFIFSEFPSVDTTSLREFSSKCYKFATRSKTIPFACPMFDTVICFSVALVDGIDATTLEVIRNEKPPKHYFGGYEMPVICDPGTKLLCYSIQTPNVGALFYDHFRDTIRKMLSP